MPVDKKVGGHFYLLMPHPRPHKAGFSPLPQGEGGAKLLPNSQSALMKLKLRNNRLPLSGGDTEGV